MSNNKCRKYRYPSQWRQVLQTAALVCGGFLVFGFFYLTANAEDQYRQAVAWPNINLEQVVDGLARPAAIAHAGDGSGRLFVVEQAGIIRLVKGGVLQPTAFLDIRTKVICCDERGLLGLAFPPDFASKGYFYVNYTEANDTDEEGGTVIARYSLSADPDAASPDSEVLVLRLEQPFVNHNGGHLAFGPDGYLYIGTGDGGSAGDPGNRAQDPGDLLGKMLRIDVEGDGCVASPPRTPTNYCLPEDNPFIQMPAYRPEIWALGLRNPWRYSFDRETGDLFIADVGQNRQEEVNFQAAASPGGENYGWNILEGILCFNPSTGCVPPPAYSAPVAWYDHGTANSNGCSVTGGYVYRGLDFPSMIGVYFYGDFCRGNIYGLRDEGGWQTKLLATAPFTITTFGEDEAGALYVADNTKGAIYSIQAEGDLLSNRIYFPLVSR